MWIVGTLWDSPTSKKTIAKKVFLNLNNVNAFKMEYKELGV
ncbi:hypothetical protein BACI71_30022 [Bacillus mycoides]|uniref:Uncharacterized protein n=1 Tax=Bacillus mycoides TaxID=1405 RepID=A0A653W330_BACMY|nr:hypothetical protein BACI71_30022 [Bacillus mycoides]